MQVRASVTAMGTPPKILRRVVWGVPCATDGGQRNELMMGVD